MEYKKYKVKFRRGGAFKLKPEAEKIDGMVFEFTEAWVIGNCDTGLPIVNEIAMQPNFNDKSYPADAPSWIASGDLELV